MLYCEELTMSATKKLFKPPIMHCSSWYDI